MFEFLLGRFIHKVRKTVYVVRVMDSTGFFRRHKFNSAYEAIQFIRSPEGERAGDFSINIVEYIEHPEIEVERHGNLY